MTEAENIVASNERKIELITTAIRAAFASLDIPVEQIHCVPTMGQIRIKFDDHHESLIRLPENVDTENAVIVVLPDWKL